MNQIKILGNKEGEDKMGNDSIKEIKVDEKLGFGKALFYGFQSVIALNLFLGAVIIAGILKLNVTDTAVMVTVSLLAIGIATCIQAGLFMRYPVVQGVSFATIGAVVAIAMKQDLATAFGSLILGAVIITALGYFNIFSKLLRFIPPVVAGTVVVVIGISLMFTTFNSLLDSRGQPGINILLAFIVFSLIFLFMVVGNLKLRISNLISRGGVLYSIIITTVIASFTGVTDFSAVAEAPWFSIPPVFPFGTPKFELTSSLIFVFIYFIVMIETVGNWYAISFTANSSLTDKRIDKGILGEGIGCLVGAMLGSAPVTSYATNCGVIAVTRVYSYWAALGAGIIIVVLSFCPKLMFLIASIPGPVMFGTLGAMSIMVLMSGLRAMHNIELNDRNILIIGIPVFITVCVSLLPGVIVDSMPTLLSFLFSSSITVGALAAVIINLIVPETKEQD
jgi:uracil-xanthine permease